MPNYRGHVAGGVAIYTILLLALNAYCASLYVAAEWLLCAIAGALFPDIDTKSKGQKYFYWLVLCLILMLIIKERLDLVAVISVFAVTPLLVKHRGVFHHVWFILLVPSIAWFIMSSLFPNYAQALFFDTVFFIAGALSHIWLDMHAVPRLRSAGFIKRKRAQQYRR